MNELYDKINSEEKKVRDSILLKHDKDGQIESLKLLLKKYEEWEADVILTDECWDDHATPRLTQKQWDKLLELQTERNRLLTPSTDNR